MRVEIPLPATPLTGQTLPYQGEFRFDLAPLALEKGDLLKLMVEASDYRGSAPGRSQLSEPLYLEISDEIGVLTAITQTDERLESELGDVIQQQLRAGGTP
jgi:hypothetical protein